MEVPVWSTGHLKQTYAADLGASIHETTFVDGGCFVYVCTPIDESTPDYLVPVIQKALELHSDISWIRFDEDGDIIDGLPVFEW